MGKIKEFFRKNGLGIALFVLISAAIFVRTYNFNEYLYFKMDQGRDASLIRHAVEDGPGLLPLLGPRAGATQVDNGFLRLGPAYYYFQYISAKIFNSTEPYVFAYPDLFFSIAAIALLYFFARLYFPRNISLAIAAMYAFSFIIIEYSRFAWNPNSLQFFTLLAFFSLLKFLNEKRTKRKIIWVAFWSLSLAIGSQLHFFGFFVLLGVSGLFILFRSNFWKKESFRNFTSKIFWKSTSLYAAVFIAVFALIYTPVIVSDVIRKGENAGNFVQALSSKPSDKPLIAKISKNFTENTKYYCLVTTSFCNVGKLEDSALPATLTLLLFILGISSAALSFRKEGPGLKKDFLLLLFIWIGVFFVLTVPVSFDLRPRFFILVFAVPFILAGFILDFIKEKWPEKSFYPIVAIFGMILLANMYGTYAWFSEQKNSQIKSTDIDRTLILKAKDGITLGQLQRVVDFIYENRKEGRAVYFYVKPEHIQPIKYLLGQKKDPSLRYAALGSHLNQDPDAQFFAVIPSFSNLDGVEDKYASKAKVISSKKAGQLTVYEVEFPDRVVADSFKVKKSSNDSDRVFWKDVFGMDSSDIKEEEINEEPYESEL